MYIYIYTHIYTYVYIYRAGCKKRKVIRNIFVKLRHTLAK